MLLQRWLDLWPETHPFIDLMEGALSGSGYRATVQGVDPSAGRFLAAGLAANSDLPTLVITPDAAQAEKAFEDFLVFFPPSEVHLLPSRELFVTGDLLTQSAGYLERRLHFFDWAISGSKGIYVAPLSAILSRAVPPAYWRNLSLELHPGERFDRDFLLKRLMEMGYNRVPRIEGKGQFSVRGEIIDIFPPEKEQPLRVEMFEETISSLRRFDCHTQRSTGALTGITINPALELVLTPEKYGQGERALLEEADQLVTRLIQKKQAGAAEKLQQKINRHRARLAEPGGLEILSTYFSYFYGTGSSILDYIDHPALIILEEPAGMVDSGTRLRKELEEHCRNCFLQGEFLPGQVAPLFNETELLTPRPLPVISLSLFLENPIFPAGLVYDLAVRAVPNYYGQWEMFQNDARKWLGEGYRISVPAATAGSVSPLFQQIKDLNLPVAQEEQPFPPPPGRGRLQVVAAGLDRSFILPSLQLAVISEHNLIPRRRKKKSLGHIEGIYLRHYRELSPGDYVVHEQHGVGKYLGLSTLDVNGLQKDYLQVKYRGADKLYIPVDQIQLIQKYIGEQGKTPAVHSLGGGEWQRLKNKVSASVRELAGELLAIYARREASPGYAFSPDHLWQQEFEAQFPYEETPDQLQAIAEVKRDMERSQPMDRLICGDVGYGKTEVALRAAFKAAVEGKQVALLVPTTILAQQHFRTFRERLADFPINVAQISRFVPVSRQKEILKELADGRIDIIIGTHRLFSRDVKFQDLGLLIIDEEQRFGVCHKEKLKKLRLEVDVLAMTATPIPRTLHLSVIGVRDLSVIDTPPENRYPVQTFVMEYCEQLVIEAVQRELNRKGQVYIVFNRVQGIEAFAEQLQKLIPQARIAIGHGRMPESRLEQVMSSFLEQKYDVLVSTTIVEAGLDIPNVNTMIIYEADRFGLAQLYQLRGRVGRSNRLAYAFLTYRKDKILTGESKKRLQAVKDFTELGSGFKIALRDLEIRGAGNMLGAEQHGFMMAVGFDLYCRLLEQAITDLKQGKPKTPPLSPKIDLKVSAFIPPYYIAGQDQKIEYYHRIYASASEEELTAIAEELRDVYGTLPAPVENLIWVARLKILAEKTGVMLVQQQPKQVLIFLGPETRLDPEQLLSLARGSEGKVSLLSGKRVALRYKLQLNEVFLPGLVDWLDRLQELSPLPREVLTVK